MQLFHEINQIDQKYYPVGGIDLPLASKGGRSEASCSCSARSTKPEVSSGGVVLLFTNGGGSENQTVIWKCRKKEVLSKMDDLSNVSALNMFSRRNMKESHVLRVALEKKGGNNNQIDQKHQPAGGVALFTEEVFSGFLQRVRLFRGVENCTFFSGRAICEKNNISEPSGL